MYALLDHFKMDEVIDLNPRNSPPEKQEDRTKGVMKNPNNVKKGVANDSKIKLEWFSENNNEIGANSDLLSFNNKFKRDKS